MSILKIDELNVVSEGAGFSGVLDGGVAEYKLSKRGVCVRDSIGELKMGMTVHFVTAAQWAMHDLLEYLLSITGPACVFMTMYSVSEDPARVISSLRKSGKIMYLAGLIDWHVKHDKSRSFQTVQGAFDVHGFQNVHAKVIAIENLHWRLNVVARCNFNKNKRFEAGVISVTDEAFHFHRDWIMEEITKCNSIKKN